MRNMFVVAMRETRRFRARFSGRSRIVVPLVALAAVAVAFLASQHGLAFNDSIYVIGASPDAPEIGDSRIVVQVMGHADGMRRLQQGDIDAYLKGMDVVYRDDDRSKYAVEALRQYFEAKEIRRIARAYDLNRSFPLRIQVEQLEMLQENVTTGGLSGLAGATPAPSGPPASGSPSPAHASPRSPVTTGPGPSPAGSPGDNGNGQIMDSIDGGGGLIPAAATGFIRSGDVLVPSLMEPPLPLAQILVAFTYVVPLFFISIFFTGSFMEEKVSRRLIVLMSAPVTPLEVIAGKMLPYLALSVAFTLALTLAMGGDLPLSLAIMLPVSLFVFAIYLLVAIFYRTFKDQTFFSIAAIAFVTAYLVFPALFAGVSEVSYISPLTLIVQMYKGQPFGLKEYLFAVTPMCAVFAGALALAARTFQEEFLAGYGPLHRKLGEAIYMAMDRRHRLISVAVVSFCTVPLVFMAQLAIIALSANLPGPMVLGTIVLFSVLAEEAAKSAGIAGLIDRQEAGSPLNVLLLCLASAAGFLAAEKALLFISLGFVSKSLLMSAIASSGLLVMPLLAHFAFTTVVCGLMLAIGVRRYALAVAVGGVLHFAYNMAIMGAFA